MNYKLLWQPSSTLLFTLRNFCNILYSVLVFSLIKLLIHSVISRQAHLPVTARLSTGER